MPTLAQALSSPQKVTRRRRLTDTMMQQGTDTSPVQHPFQALARVVQGGMGGYMAGKADKAEQAGLESVMQNLDAKNYEGVMANPWASDGQSRLAQTLMERDAPKSPIEVGGRLIDPNTYKPVYEPPPEPVKPTSEIQNFEYSQEHPEMQQQKLDVAKAGASNIHLNEGEQKTALFYSRGVGANKQLETLDKYLTSAIGNLAEKAGPIGNYAMSKEYQLARRAKLDFLAVVARKDSGAQVTKQDEDMIGPAFFPGPGENSPEIIEAKRQARQLFLDSLRFSMGNRGDMLEGAPQQQPASSGGDTMFDHPEQIPEGATVEDENGQRLIKQNGQLVPVQ